MDNSAAEDTGGTRMKRKRRLSEKVLELQAEKVKKPLQKKQPSGKSSKSKTKSEVEVDTSTSLFADDVNHDDD